MQILQRERRSACEVAGDKCEFNVAHTMIHHGLDGRVFWVRRLVCATCGERVVVAKPEQLFVPPAWLQDGVVEANF